MFDPYMQVDATHVMIPGPFAIESFVVASTRAISKALNRPIVIPIDDKFRAANNSCGAGVNVQLQRKKMPPHLKCVCGAVCRLCGEMYKTGQFSTGQRGISPLAWLMVHCRSG